MDSGGTDTWVVLLAALVGGAIGTLLTWSFAFAARLRAIPREIAANDRAVHERDEDLEQWVADEHVRVKREVRDTFNSLAGRGAFHSGETGYQVGLVKEHALQAYRDQERRAKREVALIRDREGWLHLLYRVYFGQPALELQTPQKAEPVLAAWRAPVSRHLQPTDEPAAIDDPTARTIEDTVADAENNPGELT